MALDEMNNAMPPKELNEKNLAGKVEQSWISEKNEEMQNSNWKEYGELIALRDARRKDTWTPPTRILMNSWENGLNHEELRWQKDGELEWRKKE